MTTLYDGKIIFPTTERPWSLVVLGKGTYNLYGIHFVRDRAAGLAASSGFGDFAARTLAVHAYYIDTSSLSDKTWEIINDKFPMVDPQLPPLTMIGATPFTFKTIEEAMEHTELLKPMTQLSMDLYAQVFRVIGAKVGRYNGNGIVWEKPLLHSSAKMEN